MQIRKILVLAVFISLLAISAVSASDNITGDIVSAGNETFDAVISDANRLMGHLMICLS